MNETFKAFMGFSVKTWSVTDDYIVLKEGRMPIQKITSIKLVGTPSTIATNGVFNVIFGGKEYILPFAFAAKSRAHQVYLFLRKKIDEAHGVIKDYKFIMISKTGTIWEVYDDYVITEFLPAGTLIANSMRGGTTGRKRINYVDITSIQFREPANSAVGFIQLSYPGSIDGRQGVIEAVNDENAILVDVLELEQAREIVKFMEDRRLTLRNPQPQVASTPTISVADEIKKFKELLDMGAITQEEFDAKKKELLNL